MLDPNGGEHDGGDPVAPVKELLHERSKQEKVTLGATSMKDKDMMGLDRGELGNQEGEKEKHCNTFTFQPSSTTVWVTLIELIGKAVP